MTPLKPGAIRSEGADKLDLTAGTVRIIESTGAVGVMTGGGRELQFHGPDAEAVVRAEDARRMGEGQ